jgi:hypothetical protein
MAFFGSILIALLSNPAIGTFEEIYRFAVIFGGFSLIAVDFLWQIPVYKILLNLPGVTWLANYIKEGNAEIAEN